MSIENVPLIELAWAREPHD